MSAHVAAPKTSCWLGGMQVLLGKTLVSPCKSPPALVGWGFPPFLSGALHGGGRLPAGRWPLCYAQPAMLAVFLLPQHLGDW